MKNIINFLFKIANVAEDEVFWFSDDCKELRSEVLNLNIEDLPILLIADFDTARFYRKSEILSKVVDFIEESAC